MVPFLCQNLKFNILNYSGVPSQGQDYQVENNQLTDKLLYPTSILDHFEGRFRFSSD